MRKFQENLKVELRHIANITDFVGEFPQHVVALCFFLMGLFLIVLIFPSKIHKLFILFLFCTTFW